MARSILAKCEIFRLFARTLHRQKISIVATFRDLYRPETNLSRTSNAGRSSRPPEFAGDARQWHGASVASTRRALIEMQNLFSAQNPALTLSGLNEQTRQLQNGMQGFAPGNHHG